MALQFKKCLILLLLLISTKSYGGLFRQPFENPLVSEVVSFGLTVHNMERSVAFYTDVLTFKVVADFTLSGASIDALFNLSNVKLRVVHLRLGDESLELMEFLSPKGRTIPQDMGSDDRMFQHIAIVVSSMKEAYMALLKHGLTSISSSPQRLPFANQDTAGVEVFYFKDPDGHPLQLIHFPPGKGSPKWQMPMSRLFLGIDHTAIVVANTQKSLQFYHTLLGLKPGSKNFYEGFEYERLTSVDGAKVQVTPLEAAYGPGIELIDYLYPTTGRDMPSSTKPNDLWHWQIQLKTPTFNKTYQEIMQARVRLLSRGAIQIQNQNLAFRNAFIALDPDGHSLLITTP